MSTISIGDFEIPKDWSVDIQVTLKEPPNAEKAPFAQLASPRAAVANIVIKRYQASHSDASAARDVFLHEGTLGLQELQEEGRGEVEGADGVSIAWVRFSFDVRPKTRLLQHHAFRIEPDRSMTHILATIDSDRAELMNELVKRVESYRAPIS